MWVLEERLRARGELVRGKVVLVRRENATAVAYAHHRAGRAPDLSRPASSVKEREIHLSFTAVALHIIGRDNDVADALSRFSLGGTGGDSYPGRGFRSRFRGQV